MTRPTLILSLLSALAFAPACGDKDDSSTDDSATDDSATDDSATEDSATDDSGEEGVPLLAITSPAFGEALAGSAVQLGFTIQNFELSDHVGEGAAEGEGHYHIFVDGDYRDFGHNPDTAWATRLTPGDRNITVELVNNDHTSLDPVISDTVQVTVTEGAPFVAITTPTMDQSINSSAWPVEVNVVDFTLDEGNIGGSNQSGYGHYHVYVDGNYVDAVGQPSTWLQQLPAGPHEVRVVLAENDHTELTSVDYVRASSPEDRPNIAITAPPNGETVGSDFNVTVAEENFVFDGSSVGLANVDGQGHWHVYVDGVYQNYSATNTVEVQGIGGGAHLLRVELQNNDHSELAERVFHEVSFNVAN